jgi:hypothetical protein
MNKPRRVYRPDGSFYITLTSSVETRSIEELKDLERMSRAIEAFGTSA